MLARLALSVVGVLLMVGPAYTVSLLDLVDRLQPEILAAVQVTSLAIGLLLLYVGVGGRQS